MTGRKIIELLGKEERKQDLSLEYDRITLLKRREGKNQIGQPLFKPFSSLRLPPVSGRPKAFGLFSSEG